MKQEIRFVGRDGEFVPSIPKKSGIITISYLEELCEYLYYHNNLSNEEKMKKILVIEKLIVKLLNENFNGLKFKPTWSTKLKS